ncbi:hypothetical protein V1279_002753 [Bradyrhizobium sp. AZCC 1610]|uniref:hypothetical protein n=1 Tax=Bradyrhizobium sp. AZCC 1610 TaxID=3117020 RepID=UPI002FEE9BDA
MKQIFVAVDAIGILGLLFAVPLITWTKMTLGSVLTIAGAYFNPLRNAANPRGGEATIKLGKFEITLSGGLRFVVVVAGLILVIASAIESVEPVKTAINTEIEKRFPNSNDAIDATSLDKI